MHSCNAFTLRPVSLMNFHAICIISYVVPDKVFTELNKESNS